MNAIVLDIESAKAVLMAGEQPEINPVTSLPYEYVNAFDAPDMGISVVGVWDLLTNEPPDWYFVEQLPELGKLIEQRRWVGTYNGENFDLKHLAYAGLEIPQWKSVDLSAILYNATGKRCSLGDLASVNLGTGKSGSGKDAPLLWQQYCADRFNNSWALWQLVNYCRGDVGITRRLLLRAANYGALLHPKLGRKVKVELPEGFTV